jgi:diguanylate cyclase (GGDEF)-like protein
VGVLETCLYRVDEKGHILRHLKHSRMVVTGGSGGQRVTERVEEVNNDLDVSNETKELLDSVRMLGRHCGRKVGADLLICFPLHGGNELRGYFVFKRDRELTAAEESIVHGVLEVFTNYYVLLDTSQRDQLTGLLNRYSLETNLDRLWNLLSARIKESKEGGEVGARRETVEHSYWLGVFDIDHFKNINDTHGHIIGDEVLIMVTRLLESSFRQSDLLYRFGGEEFIAIIAANDLESATLSFERARKKIDEFIFPQIGHITISGGFCGADPSVLPQEVINRADSALYAAKNAGRNRIFHYDTLVKEGVLKEVASGSIDLF